MRVVSAILIAAGFVVAATVRSSVGQDEPAALPYQVGVTEDLWAQSPSPYRPAGVAASTVWTRTFQKAGATFVRVHFTVDSGLDADGDDLLVVRDAEGEVIAEYRADEMADRWTPSSLGESLTLELIAVSGGPGIAVDRAAWGTVPLVPPQPPATAGISFYSICDTNVPARIRLSDPVASFMYLDDCGGWFACTGFLFSPQSHFLTNAHCANSPTEASSVEARFNYQDADCDLLGRPNWETFVGAQFYAMDCNLDYSVLIINPRSSGTIKAAEVYGHMQLSNEQPAAGEELWIPQHPNSEPKEIAEDCQVGVVGVSGFNACADPPSTCNNEGFNVPNAGDLTFDCRIEHGSSGSPVLNLDNVVIGLAHAGSVTQNYGVRMEQILPDIPNRPLSLSIAGPSTVSEGATVNFTATAAFLTTPLRSVSTRATWSVTPPTLGTIVNGSPDGGRFTASSVDFNRTVTIGATYTSNGVTVNATKQIIVIDVPTTIAIVGSDPPQDAIDAGRPLNPNTLAPQGWQSVTATFDGDVSPLSSGHFSVSEQGAKEEPPSVSDLVPVGFDTVQLSLSGPIQPGAWTFIRHDDSGSEIRIGFLPGDVDGNTIVMPTDVEFLVDELSATPLSLPLWSLDLDRSGVFNVLDVMTGVELLLGSGPFQAWNGVALP